MEGYAGSTLHARRREPHTNLDPGRAVRAGGARVAFSHAGDSVLKLGANHHKLLFLVLPFGRRRVSCATMLPTLVRRMAQAVKPEIPASTNPSKLKKVWPPDFSKLSPQEQLRFEKRYKRRIAHIAQRPTWTKVVKLTQYFTISCEIPQLSSFCH